MLTVWLTMVTPLVRQLIVSFVGGGNVKELSVMKMMVVVVVVIMVAGG